MTFNRHYLPGYRAGGPIRTLANMVERLGDEFDFYLVTLDRDSGDSEPYLGCKIGEWGNVGKAKVMYLPIGEVSQRRLVSLVKSIHPDILYLNSLTDPVFTQRILLARLFRCIPSTPIIIAPRGELSQSALQLHYLKKKIYLIVTSILRLYRGLTWQASSEFERNDILRNLSFVRPNEIREAMDLAPSKSYTVLDWHIRQTGMPLRICFLSRISPMKNLDFALRVLHMVKVEIKFTIYGPQENPSYWRECESLISSLPPNIKVDYAGEVDFKDVCHCLAQHDLFFLPTRGENYGHVIQEALQAGLPVLISDQTPWQEINELGVGWKYPLDGELAFVKKIEEIALWDTEQFESVKRHASEYAHTQAKKEDVLEANRQIFLGEL